MNWDAISAVGTIIAAFVGIAGIWISFLDKRRRLVIQFELIPLLKLYICNPSTQTIIVTKMRCSIKTSVFYVEVFDGLREIRLAPSATQSISIAGKSVYDAYHKLQLNEMYSPSESVEITLFDNYNRKYVIKTGATIASFNW